jgi:uncharacterized protein YndB with AHSA1/START domain/DNA-binding transcriptional ArsR family regulator
VNPDAALKALAEPHRRTILQLVARDPRPVGDIAGHLDITPQAVSRHLKVLREAGLVDERREGTRHLFVVNPGGFSAVQEFLAGFWAEHLGRLQATLQDHDDPAGGLTSVSELFATEVDLPAPAEEVFRHLTDPAAMIRWMGQHATLRPVPGGAFEIDINGVPVRGRYLELDPPRRVLVSWGVAGNPALPPGATQVEFTLTPTPAGTRLRLVHRSLPPDQAPIHATGWQHFLGRLALAAAGQDPGPDPWHQTASPSN